MSCKNFKPNCIPDSSSSVLYFKCNALLNEHIHGTKNCTLKKNLFDLVYNICFALLAYLVPTTGKFQSWQQLLQMHWNKWTCSCVSCDLFEKKQMEVTTFSFPFCIVVKFTKVFLDKWGRFHRRFQQS